MKRMVAWLVLSAAVVLSACQNESGPVPKTETETIIENLMAGYEGPVDFDAFLADVQRGVWMSDHSDIVYTDGSVMKAQLDGGNIVAPMMLFPGGTSRYFFAIMPDPPVYSDSWRWSVSDQRENTLEFYDPWIEESAPTKKYDQYAARTTLELLYYRDGVFIMKGIQPFAYWGGDTSRGLYYDYCMIVGHIATDSETVDLYLSYGLYVKDK